MSPMRRRSTGTVGPYGAGGYDDTVTSTPMRRRVADAAPTDVLARPLVPPVAAGRSTGAVGMVTGGLAAVERTAEIPVVTGATGRQRPPVQLEDGTVWYPGVSRRLPAPFVVRLVVWLLFFVLLLGLGGLAVVRWHPDWLSFVQATVPSGPSTSALGGATGGHTSPGSGGNGSAANGAGGSGLQLVSSSANSSTYAVPVSSYQVVVTFPNRAWVRIASPAGSTHDVVAETYPASASPVHVAISGSADVYLGASTTSIAIVARGRTVGTIASPAVGHDYLFQPAG